MILGCRRSLFRSQCCCLAILRFFLMIFFTGYENVRLIQNASEPGRNKVLFQLLLDNLLVIIKDKMAMFIFLFVYQPPSQVLHRSRYLFSVLNILHLSHALPQGFWLLTAWIKSQYLYQTCPLAYSDLCLALSIGFLPDHWDNAST